MCGSGIGKTRASSSPVDLSSKPMRNSSSATDWLVVMGAVLCLLTMGAASVEAASNSVPAKAAKPKSATSSKKVLSQGQLDAALLYAIRQGNAFGARSLLRCGASPNARDRQGNGAIS